MANNVIKRVWNQNRMVSIEDLKGMTFQAESGGHTFQISGVDDAGNVIALSGSVAGVFLRPDNTDVAITGSASGGVVSVTLPANCYDVPGRFGLTVFVTANGQKTAVYAAIGTVSRTSSGTVSPGTTSDVVDLINRINAAVATIPASWTGLMADIAPTYSDAAVYPVGAYCYYNGDLYRCTTAITTAESWTAGHWTQAVLGNDVSDLKSAFNNSQQYKKDIIYTRFVNGRGVAASSGAYHANTARAASHLTRLWKGQTIFTDGVWEFVLFKYDASENTITYETALMTNYATIYTATEDIDVVIVVRKNDNTDIADSEINEFRMHTYSPIDVADVLPTSVYFNKGYGLHKDSGDIFVSNSYQTSEYVPVEPGQACWITAVFGGSIVNDNYSGAYGYDKNKQFVGCVANLQTVYGWKNLLDNNGSLCYVYKQKVVIPNNVYYVRMSSRADDVIGTVAPCISFNVSNNIYKHIGKVEEYIQNETLLHNKNQRNSYWEYIRTADVQSLGIGANKGKFIIGSTIGLKTVTNVEHCYVDVVPGECYSVTLRTNDVDGSTGLGACFTDNNNEIVGQTQLYAPVSGTYAHVTQQVVVPIGATRLWVFSKVQANPSVVPNQDLFIAKLKFFTHEEFASFKELYIGEIVQGASQSDGSIATDPSHNLYNLRLSQKDVIALPRGSHNKKLKVFCAPTVLVYIRFGKSGSATDYSIPWCENGDEIVIPEGYNYYRVGIGRGHKSYSAGNLQISTDFQHEVRIYYVENDTPKLNGNELHCANAILDTSVQGRYAINSYPVIAHTSDVHGDHERLKRFMDYCDRRGVDLACITGDLVSFKPENNMTFVKDLIKQHATLSALCAGNHDVNKNDITDEEVFAEVFEGIEQIVGNETEKTWYCKDIPEKSLRMISINCYQYGGGIRSYQHYTTEQMEWLCQTLAETPAGYGVLLLAHQPFSVQEPVADHIEFFQSPRATDLRNEGLSGTPVLDIIDAFIGKTTLSKSYTQSGTPASFSVSADFTNLNDGVEFIAHVNGHTHQDGICYASGCTERQLYLNVTCTVAAYGGSTYPYICDIGDQARNPADGSQDAFNIYVIDRSTKNIRVVRIGNTITKDYAERDHMIIPYA